MRSIAAFRIVSGLALMGCSASSHGQNPDAGNPSVPQRELAHPNGVPRPFDDGTRLRARILASTSSDAVRFAAFHDTDFDTDCTLGRSSDGELRCLPTAGPDARWSFVYRDDACTEPALRATDLDANTCAERPGAASLVAPSRWACSEFRVTPAYRIVDALSAQAVFAFTDAGCVKQPETNCLFALEPLSPDALVRAQLETEPVDDAVSIDRVVYADGARAVRSIRDRRGDRSCSAISCGGDWRCFPSNIASLDQDRYADAACSVDAMVAATLDTGVCSSPSVGLRLASVDCVSQCSAVELGAPLDSYFTQSVDGCVPGTMELPAMYATGSSVPLDAFPLLHVASSGTGRLELTRFGGQI